MRLFCNGVAAFNNRLRLLNGGWLTDVVISCAHTSFSFLRQQKKGWNTRSGLTESLSDIKLCPFHTIRLLIYTDTRGTLTPNVPDRNRNITPPIEDIFTKIVNDDDYTVTCHRRFVCHVFVAPHGRYLTKRKECAPTVHARPIMSRRPRRCSETSPSPLSSIVRNVAASRSSPYHSEPTKRICLLHASHVRA